MIHVAAVFGAVVAAAALWLVYRFHARPGLERYRAYFFGPHTPSSGALKVTFLGVTSLLFDDGETAVLTDGFFTRPGILRTAFTRLQPDREIIDRTLDRAGIGSLAAVIALHSHYDHTLDSPVVAGKTGGLLIGSESTANIGRGYGLPEKQIKVVTDGETIRFGRFTLTFLLSVHSPHDRLPGAITAPLAPPARLRAFKTGDCYSLLVEHDGKTVLVQGSAGFVTGALAGRRAETVLLGTGTLGKQTALHRENYWREVVETVGARRVIPIHWDDFWKPLDRPLVPFPGIADDFDVVMTDLAEQSKRSNVELKLAAAWQPFDPFPAGNSEDTA